MQSPSFVITKGMGMTNRQHWDQVVLNLFIRDLQIIIIRGVKQWAYRSRGSKGKSGKKRKWMRDGKK